MKFQYKLSLIILCIVPLAILVSGCQTPGINGVEDNSKEYIQFEQFHVEKNFIHSDTALQIVFRSKEDEIAFFKEHPIKSRFPFPEINYEHNDVVGICLGQRDARGAYVTIDSVILNEQREIQVYSTEYDFVTEFPSKKYPIRFAHIPKLTAPFVFSSSKKIKAMEPKEELIFTRVHERIPNIISDTITSKTIRSVKEESDFISSLTGQEYKPRWNINFKENDLIAIVLGWDEYNYKSIQIEDISIVNREAIIVIYSFKSTYNYAPIIQQYVTIPKFGFPVEFVEVD